MFWDSASRGFFDIVTSTQKHAEYLEAQAAGDVILAADLWRQFLSLVEAEMIAKTRENYDTKLMHDAG